MINRKVARLDFFWGGYLPSVSINYVAISKDMKLLVQRNTKINRKRDGVVTLPWRLQLQ